MKTKTIKKTDIEEVKKLGNILIIKGKMYEPIWDKGVKSGEFLKFRLIKDKKEYLKKIDKIAERLSKNLDSKEVIRNAIGELPKKDVEKLFNIIFVKKKKVRTRQRHGCYEMLVGGEALPIR